MARRKKTRTDDASETETEAEMETVTEMGPEIGPGLAWFPTGKRLTKPAYNRLLVCSTLFREGPESRAGLHQRTGIPLSRLSEVCGELIRAGLVRESFVAPADGGGRGRPQTLLEIDLRRLGAACVQYDRDHVAAALVDLAGTILWRRRWEGPFHEGAGRLLRRISSAARMAVEAGARAGIPVLAVGAADPGTVDVATGRSLRAVNMQGWQDVPVVAELRRATGHAAVIERGDGWQALGEVAFGAGRGAEHAVFVTLLEGIGGGIVENGRLLQGRDGSAGEIGHTRVSEDGPPCGCGGRGCLEAHLAPERLVALWGGAVPRSHSPGPAAPSPFPSPSPPRSRSRSRSSRGASGAEAPPNDAFAWMLQAARDGDPRARAVLDQAGLDLARGLGNVVSLLNPECIILGGRFVEAGDLVLEPLVRALPRYALSESARGVRVRLAELGEPSAFLGVAAHFRDRLFADPSVGAGFETVDGPGAEAAPVREAAS